MRIAINTGTRQVVTWANEPVTALDFTRGDIFPVEIRFIEGASFIPLPAGATGRILLKPPGAYAGAPVAAALSWVATGSGRTATYTFTLSLDTAPIAALFAEEPASRPLALEIEWQHSGTRQTTIPVPVTLANEYIRQTEGTPPAIPDLKATQAEAEAGTSNDKWMTPLRTKQAIHLEVAARTSADSALQQELDALQSEPGSDYPGAAARAVTLFDPANEQTALRIGDTSVEVPEDWKPRFRAAISAASLDGSGKVPSSQLPSYVDDVLEYQDLQTLIDDDVNGNLSGKIYVTIDNGKAYRWTGSQHLEISPSEVTSVAGRTGAVTLAAADITDFTTAVVAAAPAPTTPSNSGLSITGNSLATSYNTSIADTVVSVPVGGAPAAAASTWKSKNLVQVLDDILFPTILASVGSAKSLDLAVSGTGGTLEIGTSVSRTLTATFTRGTILNGNGSTNSNPLVGAATGYTFTGTGISSTSQAGNTLSFTTPVVTGSNNWAVTATHDAGTGTYQDNKGVSGSNLDAPRAAGSLTDSTSSPAITGVHPYYYLKSASPITSASMVAAIQNGTATKIIASSTGTLSIPYAPTAEYFAVAYPSTSTTKTRYFVTALDNGAITVVFSPVATQTVTTTLWSQDYRIHVSTAALTNSNSTIELRNT